jgi:hypothetical protein
MIFLAVIALVKKKSYLLFSFSFSFIATFCALYTMNEQIQTEGTLNIYELAKLYHTKRPGIWRHSVRINIRFVNNFQ